MGLPIILASSVFDVTAMLNTWGSYGVFSYVLPFLLVFALIFGILLKSNILGDNKGVIVIIALAAGLLSLVNDAVPRFFQTIFPNLGIGLSVLLVGIILLGLFNFGITEKATTWTLFGIGALAAFFIVYYSFRDYNYSIDFFTEYGPAIISLLIIVGIILLIVFTGKSSSGSKAKT